MLLIAASMAAMITLAAQAVYATFMFVVAPENASFYVVRTQIVPAAVVNALLAAPAYVGLMRLRLLPHPAEGHRGFRGRRARPDALRRCRARGARPG